MQDREPSPVFNQDKQVGEFITEASVEALNAELTNRRIRPDRIITVLHVPGQTMAKPTTPKFRVLYRTE
jgi:hypothetical protein